VLHVLFFASGLAGLIYEVCWVRQFGNVFGNTVYSASLVAAVFMSGLGLGGWAAGKWADRARVTKASRSLLSVYGAAEVGVGVIGAGLALLLPRLGALSASISSYSRGSDGWFEASVGTHAIRYAVAITLLVPPTLLMGGTFTVLVRHVLARDVSDAGWRIGALYGANTAGAALGALLTDALLVPRVGVLSTELVAAVVNVCVGIGALAIARTTHPAFAEDEPAAVPPLARSEALVAAACVALALTGFAGMGMEIAWFRFLSAALHAYRSIFSLVLTVILTGIWIGAVVGGACQRRFGRPLELFVLAETLFAFTSLLLPATVTPPLLGQSSYGTALATIVKEIGLPSLLMGVSFPLVNAYVQTAIGPVGRRAGVLYLSNTFGAVLGAIVAGFVLAPAIGSQASLAVFAACAAAAPIALVATAGERPRSLRLATAVSAGLTIPALAAWFVLPPRFLLRRFAPVADRVLDEREGPNEIVTITQLVTGDRALVTDGNPMSATTPPAQRYMRLFAHVPLLMSDDPKRALVICFGVGNTVSAAALHPSLTRIDLADLSRNVLEHAHWFAATNHDVLSDPRVSVYVEDGRQHLRQQPASSYDLVTLEPPPIALAGVASLYSREFYELVKSRLTPTGFMTQWIPAHEAPPETILAMVRAFVDVFPDSVLLSGSGTQLILVGSVQGAPAIDLDRIEARLRARPLVRADMRRIQVGTMTELAGLFVADADAMRRATVGIAPVTDDLPSMEYTYARPGAAPASLFALAGLASFCPQCAGKEGPDARVRWIGEYMGALQVLYASEAFRRNAQPVIIALDEDLVRAASRSEYLRTQLGAPALGPSIGELEDRVAHDEANAPAHFALGYSLAQAGRIEEASREYERGLALAPSDASAHYSLAAVLASLGRVDDAVGEAHKVLAIEPSNARARRMICSIRGEGCTP
jgi:spermidine synthase